MSLADKIRDKIGNIEEYKKQIKINQTLNLTLKGPVYKAWRPSNKVRRSNILAPISTYNILLEVNSFLENFDVVTVRQIYYNLVSRQIINNNLNEYRRISEIVSNSRYAGLIPFNKIVDDTRKAIGGDSWNSMEEILRAAVNTYKSNWWRGQKSYIEVWLEKRALFRIFDPIIKDYGVNLCVGGGYQSDSQIKEGSERFKEHKDQKCVILYFGDLDPSGKDMPRDIKERFHTLLIDLDVVEVALTKNDVQRFSLPMNPNTIREGKSRGDSRREWYNREYGIDYGVELDALPPEVIKQKLIASIEYFLDKDIFEQQKDNDIRQIRYWNEVITQLFPEYTK